MKAVASFHNKVLEVLFLCDTLMLVISVYEQDCSNLHTHIKDFPKTSDSYYDQSIHILSIYLNNKCIL